MRLSGTSSFGSNDRPTCPKCGAAMYLRRAPHPTFEQDYERQFFSCSKCHHEIERNADKDGHPGAA